MIATDHGAIPAKAGIQFQATGLVRDEKPDPRLRGDDAVDGGRAALLSRPGPTFAGL